MEPEIVLIRKTFPRIRGEGIRGFDSDRLVLSDVGLKVLPGEYWEVQYFRKGPGRLTRKVSRAEALEWAAVKVAAARAELAEEEKRRQAVAARAALDALHHEQSVALLGLVASLPPLLFAGREATPANPESGGPASDAIAAGERLGGLRACPLCACPTPTTWEDQLIHYEESEDGYRAAGSYMGRVEVRAVRACPDCFEKWDAMIRARAEERAQYEREVRRVCAEIDVISARNQAAFNAWFHQLSPLDQLRVASGRDGMFVPPEGDTLAFKLVGVHRGYRQDELLDITAAVRAVMGI